MLLRHIIVVYIQQVQRQSVKNKSTELVQNFIIQSGWTFFVFTAKPTAALLKSNRHLKCWKSTGTILSSDKTAAETIKNFCFQLGVVMTPFESPFTESHQSHLTGQCQFPRLIFCSLHCSITFPRTLIGTFPIQSHIDTGSLNKSVLHAVTAVI